MKNAVYWLILIILIAAFFRFWDLKNTPPGLWSDEAMNGNNAVEAGWKVFYPENFGREGLFINIQSLFVAALGHEPWVLRLPSAIFGVLTVLGLYLMVLELFRNSKLEIRNYEVALFSAFFLATSFWHINFSRMGFRAIMAPFFLVWSFYFLFLGTRKAKEMFFILAGLLFGLGAHSYIAYRVAPIITFLPLWKFYHVRGKSPEATAAPTARASNVVCPPCLIGLFIFMAFLAALPLLWYYAQNPADFLGRTSAISIFKSSNPLGQFSENLVKTFGMFNFVGDFNWRHNLAGSPELWWPVGILFLVGLGIGIWGLFRNWKLGFVVLWFGVMLLPVALSNESLPHALRAIVLIPPAMIFAALGLEWISQKIRHQLKVFICIFLITATLNTYNQYFLRWAPNFNVYEAFQTDITEKAKWLNLQPNDIKKYVLTDSVDRINVRGAPMSFQPIIFITNTFFESKQKEKNIYYISASNLSGVDCSNKCEIIPVASKPTIYKTLKQKIPGLRLDISQGFVVLRN